MGSISPVIARGIMKVIPLLKVSDISTAVAFYTNVLDFQLKYPEEGLNRFCVDMIQGGAELRLSETDGMSGIAVYVHVADVDALYKKCMQRGLITPRKENSPVHESPVDQTWGMREFYVTDADGNTLRFAAPGKR